MSRQDQPLGDDEWRQHCMVDENVSQTEEGTSTATSEGNHG
jgi:hypothetical protein